MFIDKNGKPIREGRLYLEADNPRFIHVDKIRPSSLQTSEYHLTSAAISATQYVNPQAESETRTWVLFEKEDVSLVDNVIEHLRGCANWLEKKLIN